MSTHRIRERRKKNLLKNCILLLCLSFLVPIGIFLSTFFIDIQLIDKPYSTVLYDTHHEEIWEIIRDGTYRHRGVKIDDIPEFTKEAIVWLEDQNFYIHRGIDIKGIFRAFLNNISHRERSEGASTIDSQVIRNMYWLNEERTYATKFKEFYYALTLNAHYSKDTILENYLGNISFWYLNYGLESASHYYFGKEMKNLTRSEQIGLLVLPRNPKKYDPYLERKAFDERFHTLSSTLLKEKIVTQNEFDGIEKEKLTFLNKHENTLPYVSDYIEKYFKNEKEWKSEISLEFDKNLTEKIQEIAKNSILPIVWKNVSDYSVIIIDRKTKSLRVMIGWLDYHSPNGQVNSALAPRQAGSTMKPFTYVLAFKTLGYTPETKVLDTPTQFETQDGFSYDPKNYSLDFKGDVTIAQALSQSINVPAVKTIEEVGVEKVLEFVKKLGIKSLDKSSDYYGLALTLWVGEVSLFELTKAYSIFAYDGQLCHIKIFQSDENTCESVIEKKYTDMINLILTNRYFKLNGFPVNSNLDFQDRNVFVKTGTSRNFRDNWSIGFTDNYIVGVWVWNKDGSPMKWVSGASGAGEIFRNIVYYLEKNDTTPQVVTLGENDKKYLEISSPLSGSKFQIDTRKPLSSQAIGLKFLTNMDYKRVIWKINGVPHIWNFLWLEDGKFTVEVSLFNEKNQEISKAQSTVIIEK